MTFTSRDNAVFVQSLLVYREFRIQREGTLNFFSFPLFVHEQEKKKKRQGKESKSIEINESCNIDAHWRMFKFFYANLDCKIPTIH